MRRLHTAAPRDEFLISLTRLTPKEAKGKDGEVVGLWPERGSREVASQRPHLENEMERHPHQNLPFSEAPVSG